MAIFMYKTFLHNTNMLLFRIYEFSFVFELLLSEILIIFLIFQKYAGFFQNFWHLYSLFHFQPFHMGNSSLHVTELSLATNLVNFHLR